MSKKRNKYEANKVVVSFDTDRVESFEIVNGVAFQIKQLEGKSMLSVNFWCDFVEVGTSAITGGSELYLIVHRIPLTNTDLINGSNSMQFSKLATKESDQLVAVCFFAGEFVPIEKCEFQYLGKHRLRVNAYTSNGNRIHSITAEGLLRSEQCEIEFPW